MKEFAKKLMEMMVEKKHYYMEVVTEYGGYCETCAYETHNIEIDEEALWKEIDAFCESFQQEQTFNKDENV